MAFAIILLETFAVYLMIMMSVHTDILAMRLKRLGVHATEIDDKIIETDHRNYLNLIECFQMHSTSSSLQKSFENVFSIPFFIQFLVSGAILCVTVFQIVMMNPANEIVNFVFYLSYFMTLSTEIFLPCYFGTEQLLKNAQLTTAIYSSNWIGRPIYYQKMIPIFMEYTKDPRYLIAGKLFNLSLSNFLLVLNRMYNMYAVLMNVFD
ncbi:odorant receptor 94b-like isoform X2 [Bradysia coprophila]|nr:odorant receptor 94b-like isoform X2 [Bradysia coprophila]